MKLSVIKKAHTVSAYENWKSKTSKTAFLASIGDIRGSTVPIMKPDNAHIRETWDIYKSLKLNLCYACMKLSL